ncbi:DNA polymerase epsilon subunit 2-like protein [Sarcoptes scabiei]|uniref:DNA polymerase II subunit 2 n=1 Tax=Sarcoptes scabiei TaxID=52283 RepID=A0A131ZY80_SARSC|nr:DNA polymerase epsilon subunit 2-like protein [Sarcoptes scabiei]
MASNELLSNNLNRSQFMKKLQLSGFIVKQDALNVFESEFRCGNSYESIDDFVSQLLTVFAKIDFQDYVVDITLAQEAVNELRKARDEIEAKSSSETIIKNIIPHSFTTMSNDFKFQYEHLVQSLKRLPVFESGQFTLMTIDDLNTYESNVPIKSIVFALIRKDPSKIMQFILEDPTGTIPATFSSKIVWKEWATFENAIYLIEGSYEGQRDSFVMTTIGLNPPIQSIFPEPINDCQQIERDASDPMIVIISEIYLNEPETLKALRILFNGYNESIAPDFFILIGNFSSITLSENEIKANMNKLERLIVSFPNIKSNSKFILVPGPDEPTESTFFIKKCFTTGYFIRSAINISFATNPFYLLIKKRSLMVIANRMIERYLNNLINSKCNLNSDPNLLDRDSIKNLFESIARLSIANAHLTSGIDRNYSSVLSLLPKIPDLILLSDNHLCKNSHCQPFDRNSKYATTTSFSRDSFQFLVYYVQSNELEESQIFLK